MKLTAPETNQPVIQAGDILVSQHRVTHMVVKDSQDKLKVINLHNGTITRYFDYACDIPNWIHQYKYTHYPQGQYQFHLDITAKH